MKYAATLTDFSITPNADKCRGVKCAAVCTKFKTFKPALKKVLLAVVGTAQFAKRKEKKLKKKKKRKLALGSEGFCEFLETKCWRESFGAGSEQFKVLPVRLPFCLAAT